MSHDALDHRLLQPGGPGVDGVVPAQARGRVRERDLEARVPLEGGAAEALPAHKVLALLLDLATQGAVIFIESAEKNISPDNEDVP